MPPPDTCSGRSHSSAPPWCAASTCCDHCGSPDILTVSNYKRKSFSQPHQIFNAVDIHLRGVFLDIHLQQGWHRIFSNNTPCCVLANTALWTVFLDTLPQANISKYPSKLVGHRKQISCVSEQLAIRNWRFLRPRFDEILTNASAICCHTTKSILPY